MIHIVLDEQQQARLVDAFKHASDVRLHDRYQAVLLASRGRAPCQIARDLFVSERSVQRWLRAFRLGGIDGLRIPPGKGQPLKIPDSLAPTLKQWILDGPRACGRLCANWTYAELSAHLFKTYGIRASRRTVCNFCHKHGIRPYRPTYRFLRGDPRKQQAAEQHLQALKKTPMSRRVSC